MPEVVFEGRSLGDGDGLAEEVGLLLRGLRRPPGRDRYPHEWLARAWNAQSEDGRRALATAVATHLSAGDVRARSGAIRFFQRARGADDRGAIFQAFKDHSELFDGVEDPIEGSTGDLRKELARALANHPLRVRDPEILAALRAEALTPGRAGGVVAGLFDTDKDWLLANAKRVVEGTPAAYTTYLLNLALRRDQLATFVRDLRAVVPDHAAEAIARERFEGRPELLEEVLVALGRAEQGAH